MLTIVLDPGHVKNYNAGVSPGYYEGNAMFNLANYLKAELSKYKDVNVLVTKSRVTDNPSLIYRGQMAVKNNATVFISLHTNAVTASKDSTFGVLLIRSLKLPGSETLANNLGNAISGLIKKSVPKTRYRGCITKRGSHGDYYGVIRNSVLGNSVKYSYIIEHAFHTNKYECTWLNNDANIRNLAKVEASTIASYFKLSLKNSSPTPTPSYQGGTGTYTVKYGDSLWKIAKAYLGNGERYGEIAKLNNLANPSNLRVGQVLKMPSSNTTTSSYISYTVKYGDSLWKIAKAYLGNGERYGEIAKLNNLANPSNLRVGQVLKIKVR